MKYMEQKSLDNMTFINRVVVKRNYLALLYLNLLNQNCKLTIVI